MREKGERQQKGRRQKIKASRGRFDPATERAKPNPATIYGKVNRLGICAKARFLACEKWSAAPTPAMGWQEVVNSLWKYRSQASQTLHCVYGGTGERRHDRVIRVRVQIVRSAPALDLHRKCTSPDATASVRDHDNFRWRCWRRLDRITRHFCAVIFALPVSRGNLRRCLRLDHVREVFRKECAQALFGELNER
jgi:hypothetical protein